MFFILASAALRKANKAIQLLAGLGLSVWLSARWGTLTFGPPAFLSVAACLGILFAIYIILRPVRQAIFRGICQFLVRYGTESCLAFGVWNLLSLPASRPSLTPDYAGIMALHETYDALDSSKQVKVVEVVHRLEEWPSPIAGEAQMFLDAVLRPLN
jgi:hypothetical protein